MTILLPPLPYARDALVPFLSAETLECHYGKHHQGYVTKLNELIAGTPQADLSLEELVKTATGSVFNCAAQAWNHECYWHSMTPRQGVFPGAEIQARIDQRFGSLSDFNRLFVDRAVGCFGSGWVWLVKTATGELDIISTSNAGNPLLSGLMPLFTCDVWEHAYYIDYRQARAKYVEEFLTRIDWDFVSNRSTCQIR